MLLKVSILLAYVLVDGFFLKTYAANVSLSFEMPTNDGDICIVKEITEKGELIVKNLTVYEGDRINLTFTNNNFPNVIECYVILKGQKEPKEGKKLFTDEDVLKISSAPHNGQPYVKSHLSDKVNVTDEGKWFCQTLTLKNNTQLAKFLYDDGNKYLQHKCYVNVFIRQPKNDNIDISPIPSLWIYVGIAVGVLVFIIIIAQTAVILYLKYKAKTATRLDSLSLRAHDRDETDTKRYSKPPGVKMSRFSRMLRKSTTNDDETIYETLEELRNATEQTPPVPPVETIPTLKKKSKSQSPEVMSKSLPRPNKARPTPPAPSTLQRIPERQHSPKLDISSRPPLPLPNEQPEERSATPRMQKTPFPPIEEGHSTTNSLVRPKPGIGQSPVASELNNVFKMRKASMATSSPKFPSAPSKKHSFPSLKGKTNKVASDLNDSAEHGKFEPETPNPLPKGKSAILLGLAPGPVPKTKNTNAVKSPFKPITASDVPPRPDPTSISPLKPTFASKHAPVAKIAPLAPKPSVKPAGSVMLPRPSITSTKAPITPSNPASAVKLPKPSIIAPNPQMASLKPVPKNLRPNKPMITPNPHQPRFVKPAPQLPTPSLGKPPPPPPPKEPIQEAVYEDSGELFYNDEWTASNPHPAKFEKPAPPLPTASIGKPPPLPPPNRPTQEDVYEEFTEEYNSDEEWVYEPLEKYNIYSN